MKKYLSRVITGALALVLAAAIVPVAASADNGKSHVDSVTLPNGNIHHFDNVDFTNGGHFNSNFENHFTDENGQVWESTWWGDPKVPAFPQNGTQAQKDAWNKAYGNFNIYYVPHEHGPITGWHYDANNHWMLCMDCQSLLGLNWHQDVDNNGVCDVCKQPIVYRALTVKPSEGGKVTISAEKGTVGNRVAVTVEPDAGYKLADIRGINNNEMHSVRPCFEDVKGKYYHFIVDVWDVEIQATFVKDSAK